MPFLTHEKLERVVGTTIIWRYMGLDKFLDLITNERLFFTDVRSLTDQREAKLPANLARKHVELIAKEQAKTLTAPERGLLEKINQAIRTRILVNCWSLDRNESYALWKVYLCGATAGVAIRTSVSNLKEAIENGIYLQGENEDAVYDPDIYVGRVQYSDYLPYKDVCPHRLVTIKRDFYAYEQELRLFILDEFEPAKSKQAVEPQTTVDTSLEENSSLLATEDPPISNPYKGRYVAVELAKLVENLHLSPFMGAWFRDAIEKILEQLQPELVDRIVMSSIDEK